MCSCFVGPQMRRGGEWEGDWHKDRAELGEPPAAPLRAQFREPLRGVLDVLVRGAQGQGRNTVRLGVQLPPRPGCVAAFLGQQRHGVVRAADAAVKGGVRNAARLGLLAQVR